MSGGRHGGDIWGAARRREVPLARLIDFSANINPLGLSPKAHKRLERDIPLVGHYPDRRQQELRCLLACRYGISGDCILFGNGATQLIHLIPRVRRYHRALIVEPAFSEYRNALDRSGVEILEFLLKPSENFSFDLDRLLKILRQERPDGLFLANPNNPTGKVIPKQALSRLSAFCEDREIDLIVDEAFLEFTEEPSLMAAATRARHLVVVRSLTKSFALAGLRIGYLVSNRSMLCKLEAGIEPWSVNCLALSVAAASLRATVHSRRTIRLVPQERQYLF